MLAGTVVRDPVYWVASTLPNSKKPVPVPKRFAVKTLLSRLDAMVVINGGVEPGGTESWLAQDLICRQVVDKWLFSYLAHLTVTAVSP